MKLKELLLEDNIADKDAKAALKIKKDLMKIGKSIETGFAMIDKGLSSWNAPGLRSAFAHALKKSLGTAPPSFDLRGFQNILNNYYKDR